MKNERLKTNRKRNIKVDKKPEIENEKLKTNKIVNNTQYKTKGKKKKKTTS